MFPGMIAVMHLEEFVLHTSDAMPYRILLRLPKGSPPSSGWPLVVMLGAEGFDIAAAQIRYHAACQPPGYMDDAILVGVDYPEGNRRRFDYTPYDSNAASGRRDAACPDGAEQGGGPDFLRWLQTDLLNAVRSRCKVDNNRVTLAGHSLGGLFTLYALLSGPGLFSSFIASSPSVWWGERYLQRSVQAYHAGANDRQRELLITVGEYEQVLNPLEERQQRSNLAELAEVRARRAMIDGNRQVAEQLKSCDSLQVDFQILPGQSHRSAWPLALHYGLMQMLRKA